MSQSAPAVLAAPPLFFATTSRGTEEVLAAELALLGARRVERHRNGVAFGDSLEEAYRACMGSRIASRVLYPLARFQATDAAGFYEGVHAIDWSAHVGPERTLAVDAAGGRSPAGPPGYLVLKTKDAIVDRVREAEGARPDVDTERPDVRINVHLDGQSVTVSLDLAGRGLHRRRIGRTAAEAPLKENLAAAVLWLAGWPARAHTAPLVDPFCGSGTLLVEAAWIALDVAPGLHRERIGAEGWRGHDAALWRRIREEARAKRAAAASRKDVSIVGSDAAPSAVEAARENLRRAGVAGCVRVTTCELAELQPPAGEPGLVVTNPPYGARLGETGELGPLYERLGDVLKRRFAGWSAWVLSGNPALTKRIGLRVASRHVLWNGPIECRLLEIPIATAPVSSAAGPGWRKPSTEAAGFVGRLVRNRERLEPWARAEGLDCYRLYDSDVPEYNLSIDRWGDAVRIEEYGRPARLDPHVAERRLRDALLVVPAALGVDPERVTLRVRRRRLAGEQHERRDDRQVLHEVREGDLRFLVNLSDYLDTGLFLDDRLLRRRIRERIGHGRFLNLFAYTCTASVAAAAGGARAITSIDLSRRYLDWGRRNFELNGFAGVAHEIVRADVVRWLADRDRGERWDLIFLAPPTYSKSKAMRAELDLGRDHPKLIADALRRLAPGGELLFSTNDRGFVLDAEALGAVEVEEITAEVTPPDFERRPRLAAWSIRPRALSARSVPASRKATSGRRS
jgi:23S rRNA (guanine2445-N2)-methyltransferase / 23S rRNA (guanine2069-N7)-methyltransferase